MAADPILYCLEHVTDYLQFERLCHDLMIAEGYATLEPLGGTRDRGRDAIDISVGDGRTTVFAYSVREDWKAKLRSDAERVRECGHGCTDFVFVTTAATCASDRDEMVDAIKARFGWRLRLFSVEQLRLAIRRQLNELVVAHPQILTPSLFGAARPDAHLRIRVSPTRDRRTQLAQIVLFNGGARPLFIESWHAEWRDPARSRSSLECVRGTLPRRLLEQDQCELLVALDGAPVDSLERLGVRDGDGRAWDATRREIEDFVATARRHAPPVLSPPEPERAPSVNDVEIVVAAAPAGRQPGLDVTVKNRCDAVLVVDGCEVAWTFVRDPAKRSRGHRVCVEHTGGSVALRRVDAGRTLQRGHHARFTLRGPLAEVLVATLRQDIAEVTVTVGTPNGPAWTAAGDEVSGPIQQVARALVQGWDERSTVWHPPGVAVFGRQSQAGDDCHDCDLDCSRGQPPGSTAGSSLDAPASSD